MSDLQITSGRTMERLHNAAWDSYKSAIDAGFSQVVAPSIPVLFFGDLPNYEQSGLRVVTVALNPSRLEFPQADRFERFPECAAVYEEMLQGNASDAYSSALCSYFETEPYRPWFASFEDVLPGFDTSYYAESATTNRTLHTDLCSPVATDPPWSSKYLDKDLKSLLKDAGNSLWHELIAFLEPQVVLISVRREYLADAGLPAAEVWPTIYRGGNQNRHKVTTTVVDKTRFVFAQCMRRPFGAFSSLEKKSIGRTIGSLILSDDTA